ncbi:hypothetical protein J6V86_00975 [bacterium]|nr:hypothetical protein [bacterium]
MLYEDTIPTPTTTRTGYTFSGWINMPSDGKMPASELNLVADWTPNTGTTYYVEHYQENIT